MRSYRGSQGATTGWFNRPPGPITETPKQSLDVPAKVIQVGPNHGFLEWQQTPWKKILGHD